MSDTVQEQTTPAEGGEIKLKRVIGPKLLLLFIVGDILGAGVYAITGTVAKEVGGAAWLPFILAFAVATLTAFSYLELVTKYPQAAGAALYTHKAFGIHFVTFLVCFVVMCSGITSASTASRTFASFAQELFTGVPSSEAPPINTTLIAIGFIVVIGLINLRGVAESVYVNIGLTIIELSGLLIVIGVGFFAIGQGRADFSRVVAFDTADDKSIFIAVSTATAAAFFAMVGFEDSVNMAEETKDPEKIFPKIMLTGLSITAVIYVLVSISAVALVPVGELGGERALLTVVERGAPDIPIDQVFPLIAMLAVANTALINMMMASRLLYGMAKQRVLPPVLAKVLPGQRTPYVAILFTTALAVGLITFVGQVSALGGTTGLLLLGVFTVVNIAVLVLRKDKIEGRSHFRAPTVIPIIGAICCAYLLLPFRAPVQYQIALVLIGIGIVLWALTWFLNRALYARKTYLKDPSELE